MLSARSSYLRLSIWLGSLFLVARCTLAVDEFLAAPSTITNGEQGVMLLHDGGVLIGKISHADDAYTVVRAGSELQISPSRVSFVGRTMRDVYQFRRTHLASDTIEAHLNLADWCIRQNLFAEAEGELAIARKLQADHPRLLLLDRRLAAAKEQPSHSKPATPSTSNVIATPQPSAGAPLVSPVMPDLPDGVVEYFTRKVQPVLVNNCTAAKCHAPGSSQAFQLNRAILRGEANRRATMQNLAAALTLVDRGNPEKSRLLTLPRQSHAGMNGPVMGPRHDQAFQHLVGWVALIAPPKPLEEEQANEEHQVAVADEANGRLRESNTAVTPPAELMTPPGNPIAKHADTKTSVKPASATVESSFQPLRAPHRLRFGAAAERWQPRDPYDAEIFNRRQQTVAAPAMSADP